MKVCTCEHGLELHDYNPRSKVWGRCSVSIGDRAVRCKCEGFVFSSYMTQQRKWLRNPPGKGDSQP